MKKNTQEATCEIYLDLGNSGSVSATFHSTDGLKQEMNFLGTIWEPSVEFNPVSEFRGKSIQLKIKSPLDTKLLEQISCELESGPCCGTFFFWARLEPDSYEDDGESFEVPPVHITLFVNQDEFEVIRDMLLNRGDDRVLHCELTLFGNTLPTPLSRVPVVWPHQLDVSKQAEHAVQSFQMKLVRKSS